LPNELPYRDIFDDLRLVAETDFTGGKKLIFWSILKVEAVPNIRQKGQKIKGQDCWS
jgi:hypothetical protein